MKITGKFELNVKDLNGNIVESYIDKNLVVDAGREAITHMISGLGSPATSGKTIDRIYFGSNGTNATIADNFSTLDQTDPNLTTPNVGVTATHPTSTSVKYTWNMSGAENNGAFIREYALIVDYLGVKILFSRKVRDVIAKDNTMTLDGNWTINFE